MTHPALFDKGSPLLDNTEIFISPRAASLWPTAAWQFLSGHCTTHAGAVRHKKAAEDCTLHLDPSACQCRPAPRAPKQRYRALHRAEQPSVLRGMLWTYGHSDFRMSFSHQAATNSATTTSKHVLNLTRPLAILLFCPSAFLPQSFSVFLKYSPWLKAFVQKGRISVFGRFSFFSGSS